jgi:hypothetical protein
MALRIGAVADTPQLPTVHGGEESRPSESHRRTTGGDTSQAAAA